MDSIFITTSIVFGTFVKYLSIYTFTVTIYNASSMTIKTVKSLMWSRPQPRQLFKTLGMSMDVSLYFCG